MARQIGYPALTGSTCTRESPSAEMPEFQPRALVCKTVTRGVGYLVQHSRPRLTCLAQVLAHLHPIQLPASTSWRAVDNGACAWVLYIHISDRDGILDLWFKSDPTLPTAGVLGSKPPDFLSHCFSNTMEINN